MPFVVPVLPLAPVVDAMFVEALELEFVSDGIVSEMLTFEEPPDADEDERPPVAVDMPMPPTEEELEVVLAVEFADVPMLFRLEPPPWPMPVEVDPEIEPEEELAVVSAWASCAAQNRTAHASCKVVLFIMVLRKERGTPWREAIPEHDLEFLLGWAKAASCKPAARHDAASAVAHRPL
ncbi:hypothetical protein [Caballeronia ptereochthonis]|uniref:hypothetical protein n=1 Tax=Caballeronia ptereochthonis TaxID=1777144 RepID=UPI001FC96CCA|nr:hypothetical protein [Caballeronia ptereochthonis]